MKYQSEIVKQLTEEKGHYKSLPHYESECIEAWVEANKSAYPKLTDYQAEWLNYANEHPIGMFPYETLSDVTIATVENVVPYAYKSAILKGSTKYRDIDMGEFLETFEEGRNLELVSVKMPVLTTTGKNLFDEKATGLYDETTGKMVITNSQPVGITKIQTIRLEKGTYTLSLNNASVDSTRPLEFGFYDFPSSNWTFSSGVNFQPDRSCKTFTVTESNQYDFIVFAHGTGTINRIEVNIQLEKNSINTLYEPFKSNILTTNEEVELRKVGDVRDELDLLTGEVTERIGEIVLDGSDITVNLQSDFLEQTNTIGFRIRNVKNGNSSAGFSNNQLSNLFASHSQNYLHSNDAEGITQGYDSIYIRINRNKLVTQDIEGFKQWLSQNPITVQYQLATESVKTVVLTVSNQNGDTCLLKPIEGTMHLETSSDTIQPSFSGEIPVEATTQNLYSFIEE